MNPLVLFPLVITVWFGGTPVECLIDSGAQVTVIRASVADSIPTLGPVSLDGGLTVIKNVQPTTGHWRYARDVGTADLGWDGAWIGVFPDDQLGQPCYLGADFLARQAVTLDWAARRVLLAYPAKEPLR